MARVRLEPTRLFMRLEAPSLIALGLNGSGTAEKDCLGLTLGYPDNLSFPDILYDKRLRTLVGVSFNSSNWINTRQLFCQSDPRLVKFIDEGPLEEMPSTRLDILWAPSCDIAFEGAQIADVHFYFSKNAKGMNSRLTAFELWHIDEILATYDLAFPDELLLEPRPIA